MSDTIRTTATVGAKIKEVGREWHDQQDRPSAFQWLIAFPDNRIGLLNDAVKATINEQDPTLLGEETSARRN
jgi:hypothetical protein